jgi:hypothetical protein
MKRVREAAQRAVEETALRQVAREVGMSAPGLANFLQGGEPLKNTARKLADWYLRRTVQTPQGIDTDTAGVALALLMQGLPAAHAERLALRFWPCCGITSIRAARRHRSG